MKKIAFAALLSVSVAAIAVASGNSHAIISTAPVTNIADTTPMHHSMHKTMHHTTHKKSMKMAKPMKDSTK